MNAIILSMLEWQEAMSRQDALQALFTQGNMFQFNLEQSVGKNTFINTYPGVDVLKWNFNLVLADEDLQKNYPANAGSPNVVTFQVEAMKEADIIALINNLDDLTAITKTKAIEGVKNWNKESTRNTWLGDQLKSNGQIYEAFAMPVSDIVKGNTHQAFLALMKEKDGTYTADMIVVDISTNKLAVPLVSGSVHDTVRPVPPFKNSPGLEQKDFGLLNYVLSIHEPV